MNKPSTQQVGIFALLVVFAAGSRFLSLAPNFQAVAAVALFAGWYFSQRTIAVAAPLVAMLATDSFIGGYDWRLMAVVYAMLALPVLMGRFLRHAGGATPRMFSVVCASVLASAVFFVVTNFAVWAFAADVAYPKTLAGLTECYANAFPFFRFMLAGDVLFSVALFEAYGYVTRRQSAPALATA